MRAIIRQEYQDGKIVYQVLENGFGGQSVEFSSEDAGACEKYKSVDGVVETEEFKYLIGKRVA